MFDFVQFGADINQVHLVPACVLCLVAAQRNATGATDREREGGFDKGIRLRIGVRQTVQNLCVYSSLVCR